MSPTLLVVSGLPASGKTHLGSRLTQEQAGPLSFELMYRVAGVVLAAGGNVVLETHFYRGVSEPKIEGLAQAHGAKVIQLFCDAPREVLAERHAARVLRGERPHIHKPFLWEHLTDQACHEPLALPGPLRRVDTTPPQDPADLARWVREQG